MNDQIFTKIRFFSEKKVKKLCSIKFLEKALFINKKRGINSPFLYFLMYLKS